MFRVRFERVKMCYLRSSIENVTSNVKCLTLWQARADATAAYARTVTITISSALKSSADAL